MPATSVTGIGQGEEAAGLHSRGYVTLLLTSGLLGVPLSLVAFGFLVVVHELEHVVWHDLPSSLGQAVPPPWWPVVTIGAAGVLVALAVTHLPGRGGTSRSPGSGPGPPRRRTCRGWSWRPRPASWGERSSVPRHR